MMFIWVKYVSYPVTLINVTQVHYLGSEQLCKLSGITCYTSDYKSLEEGILIFSFDWIGGIVIFYLDRMVGNLILSLDWMGGSWSDTSTARQSSWSSPSTGWWGWWSSTSTGGGGSWSSPPTQQGGCWYSIFYMYDIFQYLSNYWC